MEKNSTDLLEFIKSRKSIRNFLLQKIDNKFIREIIECGRWAPSGLNNQPWKVCVVTHPTVKRMMAELTESREAMESAYVNLVVFLDLGKVYDRVKDILAIGAFMQNILLAAHAMNLGAVWIGEILNKKEQVNEIFKFSPTKLELMGVIAIGLIDKEMAKKAEKPRERKPIDDFIELY